MLFSFERNDMAGDLPLVSFAIQNRAYSNILRDQMVNSPTAQTF